jgi:hypothetical protein
MSLAFLHNIGVDDRRAEVKFELGKIVDLQYPRVRGTSGAKNLT